ncbi:tetratricopeptide repeat protein [Capilliphycus salinus ALCB114379]|uniref:tetratricopeptide repeat protein n=1 Tax=Capilliphycus salinus TaxID=2768948 RepID=UPI0039A44FDB
MMKDAKTLIVALSIMILGSLGLVWHTKSVQNKAIAKATAQVENLGDLNQISETEKLKNAQQQIEYALLTLDNIPTLPVVATAPQAVTENLDQYSTKLDEIERKLQQKAEGQQGIEAAKKLAWSAAKLAQNPPHTAEVWQEVHQKWQQAMTLLINIPEDSPEFANAQAKLKDYQKNYEVVNQYYEKAKQAVQLNNRAMKLIESGDYQQAISNLNEAVNLNPGQIEAYLNRGVAYSELNSHASAIANYDKAIELAPNNADAYYYRADEYLQAGNAPKALADYNKAIQLNPNYSQAYLDRGFIYYQQGESIKAIEDLQKAADLLGRQGDLQTQNTALEVIQDIRNSL